MSDLYPVILCGGVGTRLWPLSRAQHPKQFEAISSDSAMTFFQATAGRHIGAQFADPIVCVSQSHIPTVKRQLRAIGLKAQIIAEPVSRNTGPALLATALHLVRDNPNAIILALPSDHVINGDFDTAIAEAKLAVDNGLIVIFGIRPRYPETGYGYIVDAGEYEGYPSTRRISRFVEKPVAKTAQWLIDSGSAFWASGISMFRADVLIEQYRLHAPDTYETVLTSLQKAQTLEGITLLEERSFAQASNNSTESEIFERTKCLALQPAEVDWDDVGAWSAFHSIGVKTEDGNVASGDVILIDTQNSYIRGGDRLIAVVGLTDVVIVDTADALLVTTRANSQKVKKVVEQLAAQKRVEVNDHQWLITDWGRVGTLSEGEGFSLKQLVMSTGSSVLFEPLDGKRSLVTIAEGVGVVDMGGELRTLHPGDMVEIGPGVRASIANTGANDLQAVEVTCDVDIIGGAPASVIDLPAMVGGSRHYA